MIKFVQLTQDDLNTLGIGTSSFSNHSVKAIDDCNGEIVGYIVLEDIPFRLPIEVNDANKVKEYKQDFNSHQTFYLKNIFILPKLRYSGNLETMFMTMVEKLPEYSILWSKPSVANKEEYLMQLGGATNLPFHINDGILVFAKDF